MKESLELFAKLRGLSDIEAVEFAMQQAKKFRIYQFFNTVGDQLSGGNKRKLVTAIAMIGNP